MLFDDVLHQRRAVRAFKPDPVPLALVRELLDCARRSPSGTNIQPWKVHVVAGETRRRLVAEVLAHRETHPPDTGPSSHALCGPSPTSVAPARSARPCTA